MGTAPLSYVLNYILIGLSGVISSYVFLRSTFPARRSPALWFLYFVVRNVVNANLWYALGHGLGGGGIETFQAIWVFVTGFVSLLVVCASFVGDFVLVTVSAVICDLISLVCVSLGTVLANDICGLPFDAGYLGAFGLRSILTFVLVVAVALCIRMPVVWMLRWACRAARQNRMVWGVVAMLLVAFLVALTQSLSSFISLNNYWPLVLPITTASLLVVLFTLMRHARDMRRREEVVRECVELAGSYDSTIKAQLEGLERELSVLEGHERALGALEQGDAGAARRARTLQSAYRHLKAGAYCDRPALDAVLSACARRLSALGVSPAFTVAAVPAGTVVPATMALALLNLACEAAERMDEAGGEEVELRIRGVGDQVLFRLAVAETWGSLWAKRYLSAFDTQGVALVRERRVGPQRIVLAVVDPHAYELSS